MSSERYQKPHRLQRTYRGPSHRFSSNAQQHLISTNNDNAQEAASASSSKNFIAARVFYLPVRVESGEVYWMVGFE
jgi:hypothetical protein